MLTAPLDAYWEEALIGQADHYQIEIDGRGVGFYCINSDKQLVAFHVSPKSQHQGEETLSHIIDKHGVTTALAGTNDPFFLSLCLDRATSVRVHTLLFRDLSKVNLELDGFGELTFELASEKDFAEVLDHTVASSGSIDTESIETGYENLEGYLRSVMDQHHLFVLRADGELIATSECRISKTQEPYADVGMIVGVDHRRKGVGSYILHRTKEFCYERDARPICSCEEGNIGSKKAIVKAGFVAYHRIVQVELDG